MQRHDSERRGKSNGQVHFMISLGQGKEAVLYSEKAGAGRWRFACQRR